MAIETGHLTLSQMDAAFAPNYLDDTRRSMLEHCRMMLAFYERRKNEVAADIYREWLAELEKADSNDQAE